VHPCTDKVSSAGVAVSHRFSRVQLGATLRLFVSRASASVRLLSGLAVIAGCASDDPCEAARQKLDMCKDEIQKAVAISGFVSFPVTFSGECTGTNRCLAECARDVGCSELAYAISGGPTDPNAPPISGRFLGCALHCLGNPSPPPLEAGREAGTDSGID
jgi:hypothetical protein